MPVALKPEHFDITKLKYSEVKPLKNNPQAKMCGIFYNGERPAFQTPLMHMPYGVNDNTKIPGNEGQPKKYDLNLSFRGKDENARLEAFFNMLLSIEKKIKDDAFANRLTWFKKDYNGVRDVVDSLFTPLIKFDVDKETGKVQNKYPPTFKVKLPYDAATDTFKFDAWDMTKTALDFKAALDSLKGAKCQAIVQLSGLWFAGGRFGCTWRLETAKFDIPNKKSSWSFDSDSEDEDVKSEHSEEDDIAEDVAVVVGAAAVNTKVEDSDDDDEEEEADDADEADEEEDDSDLEEEVVVPPPPPPPAPVKKSSKAAKEAAAAAAAAAAVSAVTVSEKPKKSKK